MGRVSRTGNKGGKGKPSASPSSLHVEIYKGRGNWQPWRVRLVAGNGEILNVSEGYYSKWNAKRAARRVYPSLEIKENRK